MRYAPLVGRREGALSYERFLELVDSLPRLLKLTLQGLGEPLVSPHLVDMVGYAARRGVAVGFNSNLFPRISAKAVLAILFVVAVLLVIILLASAGGGTDPKTVY